MLSPDIENAMNTQIAAVPLKKNSTRGLFWEILIIYGFVPELM